MALAPPSQSGIARRQLHVFLLLDCSGSMSGDRIASLNYAMRTAVPELREVAADNPEVEMFVRSVRFAGQAEWHVGEPVPPAQLEWQDLYAGGESALGAALRLLVEALEGDSMKGRQLPPVIVLASDGLPTDDFEDALGELLAHELGRNAIRVGIAIGADADMDMLRAFISDPAIKPLKASNSSQLVEHIKWATTAPVKAASSPAGAGEKLIQPTARDAGEDAPGSDVIW